MNLQLKKLGHVSIRFWNDTSFKIIIVKLTARCIMGAEKMVRERKRKPNRRILGFRNIYISRQKKSTVRNVHTKLSIPASVKAPPEDTLISCYYPKGCNHFSSWNESENMKQKPYIFPLEYFRMNLQMLKLRKFIKHRRNLTADWIVIHMAAM